MITPSSPMIARGESIPNSTPPSATPSTPPGSNARISRLSHCPHQARSPDKSMVHNRISAIAAACGTGSVSAITGTITLVEAPAKPPLLMAETSTAGTASA